MEQKQITIVVGVIVNQNGEILLAQRNQPENPEIHDKWEFPGGGIDFGESPEQALIREVGEETGYQIKIIRLLPKIYTSIWKSLSGKTQVIILPYQCEVSGGSLGSQDPEIGDLKFIKLTEINYLDCLPKMKEIIDLLKY